MKRWKNALAAAAALLPFSWAQAQISYSYIEGDLTVHEIDFAPLDREEDAIGGRFEASYELMSFLHVFGSYQYAELDDLDAQTNFAQVGVGVHYDFSEMSSVFANISAISADLELVDSTLGNLESDDDGYGVSFGYREVNHTPLEFGMSIDYVKFNDADTDDTMMNLALLYELTPRLKIIGGIQFGGDDNMVRAGVRYYLPSRDFN
jgi:hypothetical protein